MTRILELDPGTRQVREYAGSYADYLEQKMGEHARHMQGYSDQQAEILHLRNTARRLRGLAKFRRGGKA